VDLFVVCVQPLTITWVTVQHEVAWKSSIFFFFDKLQLSIFPDDLILLQLKFIKPELARWIVSKNLKLLNSIDPTKLIYNLTITMVF